MIRGLKGFSLVSSIAVLVSVLMFAGCSINSPVAPEPDNLESFGKLLEGTSSMSDPSDPAEDPINPATMVEDEKIISAEEGGVISIERESYIHDFTVEPGAIDESTLITVKSYKDEINGREAVVFEFGPGGLVFNEASILNFDMQELNDCVLLAKLYYYDPEVRIWTLQAERELDKGMVQFEINHFSKYAISD